MEEQKQGYRKGSAFILAIVLTSLLAFIGMMFVTITRVDRIATSAIAENKALDGAIETIIAKISQQLILDTPGAKGQEYYDYPDVNNTWLASLEPNEVNEWPQISDVTEYLRSRGFSVQNVDVKPVGLSTTTYVREYPIIRVASDGTFLDDANGNPATDGVSADADGDGIADSKWIRLDGVMTTKGQPIYAAVRVIDNGGMLNVNTAYQFDPDTSDGSSQTQVDLLTLAERGSGDINDLDTARYGYEPKPWNLDNYIKEVVWRYNDPNGLYTPFDISDELELRNRFIIKQLDTHTRIKNLWTNAFKIGVWTPFDSNYTDWCDDVYYDDVDTYDYRHIATTYNMDRIINPEGDRLVNVNTVDTIADVESLYLAIMSCLDFVDANEIAAQIIANLIDYADSNDNDNVSVIGSVDVNDPNLASVYYGFERPCIYISELAHKFYMPDANDASIIYRSYAIELYKPYSEDNDPNKDYWKLLIDGTSYEIDWSGMRNFHVIYWENSNAVIDINDANDTEQKNNDSNSIIFNADSIVSLVRSVDDVNIPVDSVRVPDPNVTNWLVIDGNDHSIQRDITLHKCIRRLWDSNSLSSTLGRDNSYQSSNSLYIQAHPADSLFTNVGEIGKIFYRDVYNQTVNSEQNWRLDLTEPNFQQLFNYLTVFDPADDNINNDGDVISPLDSNDLTDEDDINRTPEWKVPGRININTAPWFVLAQLPWVPDGLAEEIIKKRDDLKGFKNIGQLCDVVALDPNDSIDYYSRNDEDEAGYPDLTGGDGAADDFEERDLIFARISNLVTVRSDVFTAYILVRAGVDGAQKRFIAILDRSDVYPGLPNVKIRALHPVPDPR